MNDTLPHAFVISLPEAGERRQKITAQLQSCGMPYSFVDAVDGRGFDVSAHPDYDREKRLKYFGRDLLGGEIGCFLSHKKLLQKIVQENIVCAVILEDDATVLSSLPAVSKALMALKKRPDLVRFLGSDKVNKSKHKVIENLAGEINLARLQSTPGGAHGYFVSNEGARKLLKKMDKIFIPIDTLMGYSWQTGVANLATVPSPVLHGSTDEESYIGTARFDKSVALDGMDKHLFPLRRALFKFTETIMKRISFYAA